MRPAQLARPAAAVALFAQLALSQDLKSGETSASSEHSRHVADSSGAQGVSPSTLTLVVVGTVAALALIGLVLYKYITRRNEAISNKTGAGRGAQLDGQSATTLLPLFSVSNEESLELRSSVIDTTTTTAAMVLLAEVSAASDPNADTISFTSSYRHSAVMATKNIGSESPEQSCCSEDDSHADRSAADGPLAGTHPSILTSSVSLSTASPALEHTLAGEQVPSTLPQSGLISFTTPTFVTSAITMDVANLLRTVSIAGELESSKVPLCLTRPPPAYALVTEGRSRSVHSLLTGRVRSSSTGRSPSRSSEDLLKQKLRAFESRQMRATHTSSPASSRPSPLPSAAFSSAPLSRPSSTFMDGVGEPPALGLTRQSSQHGRDFDGRVSRVVITSDEHDGTADSAESMAFRNKRKAASYHGAPCTLQALKTSPQQAQSPSLPLSCGISTKRPSLSSLSVSSQPELPANVSRYVPKTFAGKCLDGCPWHFGSIQRKEAEAILRANGASDGLFLVRTTAGSPDELILSVCYAGCVFHNPLKITNRGIRNSYKTEFGTLSDCLDAYSAPALDVAGSLEIQTPLVCFPLGATATSMPATPGASKVSAMPPFSLVAVAYPQMQ